MPSSVSRSTSNSGTVRMTVTLVPSAKFRGTATARGVTLRTARAIGTLGVTLLIGSTVGGARSRPPGASRSRIDIEILPRRQEVVRVLAVPADLRGDDGAADAVGVRAPRRLGGDDLRHGFVDLVALRRVGRAAALVVECVVLGIPESREVSCAGIGSVENAHEVVGDVSVPAGARKLELSGMRRLGQLRESLDLEIHSNAGLAHAFEPQVVILPEHGADR